MLFLGLVVGKLGGQLFARISLRNQPRLQALLCLCANGRKGIQNLDPVTSVKPALQQRLQSRIFLKGVTKRLLHWLVLCLEEVVH